MKKLIFALLLTSGALSAQHYRVYLSDKGSSEALFKSPTSFLSEESLARRDRQGIALDYSDLPVAKEYLQSIRDLGGSISARSRWFNYLVVDGVEQELLESLPFVKRVETPKTYQVHIAGASATGNFDYVFSRTQVEMLNGHLMHQRGYTGKGVSIAVLDAGFRGMSGARSLDSLFQSGRMLGSYNFVNGDTNVFTVGGSHGSSVLSTMAALQDSTFVGTAPHASYWLLTSEDIGSETPEEMDNWLMAAEFADSVGADVINTSLGYTTFDDPADNYTYNDMDGNTTIVTRAADWAASKGIVVVASAGNEGSSNWQHISAPADGDSVLAVGAVDGNGVYASFSSKGPSADQRTKPDVAAMGSGTTLINAVGSVSSGFGTSFSSPLVAGMAACLIQSQPTKTAAEILSQIRRSGSQFNNPDALKGYGIPNFDMAYIIGEAELSPARPNFSFYPNPCVNNLYLRGLDGFCGEVKLQVQDMEGRIVLSEQWQQNQGAIKQWSVEDLAPGTYLIKLENQGKSHQVKFIKR